MVVSFFSNASGNAEKLLEEEGGWGGGVGLFFSSTSQLEETRATQKEKMKNEHIEAPNSCHLPLPPTPSSSDHYLSLSLSHTSSL